MNNPKFPKGSEWRKWDLHVHTASSEENAAYKGHDSDSLLVSAWRKHGFAAVAITDHFVINIQRIQTLKKLAPEITIFPGVELRTDKGATNIHPILIFAEDINLATLDAAFKTFKNEKAEAKDNFDTIHWNFQDICDFAKKYNGLISIHAGRKTNSIESIPNDSPLNKAVKAGYAKFVDIFEVGKIEDIDAYNTKVFPNLNDCEKNPIIICSDNHDPRDYKIKEYLWIKANPNFEGLKQILLHRDERVFVGSIPPKIDKQEKNQSKYIKEISVKRVDNPNYSTQNWFNFDIELNTGLVAIIGSKGSGKSAFSDIIGHLCKCKTMNDASFLSPTRFRSTKGNISKDYIASLKWLDDEEIESPLDTTDYGTTIEYAQYLPQQFIEKTCNDLGDVFQNEINNVIFSYIDSTEKGNASNLEELKRSISEPFEIEMSKIKSKLSSCIDRVIQFEEFMTPEYKKDIEDNLAKRRKDLKRHNKNKPDEVKKPETQQSEEYRRELGENETKQAELKKSIIEAREKLKLNNDKIRHINILEQKVKTLIKDIQEVNEELANAASEHSVPVEKFKIIYSDPLDLIKEKKNEYITSREEIQIALDMPEKQDSENTSSLLMQLAALKKNKEQLVSTTDATEKAFQVYQEKLKDWQNESDNIDGSQNEENSIQYYSKRFEYIETELPSAYLDEKKELFIHINSIFDKKKLIVEKLINLYSPVKNELENALGAIDEKIEFNIEILLKDKPKELADQLLAYISQNVSGRFHREAGSAEMQRLIDETSFNDIDSLCSFTETIYSDINADFSKSKKKVKDKKGLYSFLGELDYLDINFVLKLGGRALQELSPGERGIVLLVFYLALNKQETPLIIDQPEDNLDNQSVYDKLVKCILKAKKNRQVIIVTHNPNIAVACDAEQIIYCSMDKKDKIISYTSGAIEDKNMRNHVIDVLEGTMPAFDLRKMKYDDCSQKNA